MRTCGGIWFLKPGWRRSTNAWRRSWRGRIGRGGSGLGPFEIRTPIVCLYQIRSRYLRLGPLTTLAVAINRFKVRSRNVPLSSSRVCKMKTFSYSTWTKKQHHKAPLNFYKHHSYIYRAAELWLVQPKRARSGCLCKDVHERQWEPYLHRTQCAGRRGWTSTERVWEHDKAFTMALSWTLNTAKSLS